MPSGLLALYTGITYRIVVKSPWRRKSAVRTSLEASCRFLWRNYIYRRFFIGDSYSSIAEPKYLW